MNVIRVVLVTVFLITVTQAGATEKTTWSKKMTELSKLLPELMVLVSSTEKFNDPNNAKTIENGTEELAKLSHQVSQHLRDQYRAGPIDTDPSIFFISDSFKHEANRASAALKAGHRQYARNVIQSVSSYCFACHTRSEFGPKFPEMKFGKSINDLSASEKADLYAATRQFDKAIEAYADIIKDKTLSRKEPILWERSVKKALALAIRVKQDPTQAIEFTNLALKNSSAPLSFHADASAWKSTLLAWKDEKKPARAMSSSAQLEQAKELIGKGKATQKFPADRAGDIYYMRASAVLHNALRDNLSSLQLSEALYYSGMAYEMLRDLGLWELPETYYESCIRQSPHTVRAQDCFYRYERNTLLGYTGTAGLALPGDVENHLKELAALAKVKKTSK